MILTNNNMSTNLVLNKFLTLTERRRQIDDLLTLRLVPRLITRLSDEMKCACFLRAKQRITDSLSAFHPDLSRNRINACQGCRVCYWRLCEMSF